MRRWLRISANAARRSCALRENAWAARSHGRTVQDEGLCRSWSRDLWMATSDILTTARPAGMGTAHGLMEALGSTSVPGGHPAQALDDPPRRRLHRAPQLRAGGRSACAPQSAARAPRAGDPVFSRADWGEEEATCGPLRQSCGAAAPPWHLGSPTPALTAFMPQPVEEATIWRRVRRLLLATRQGQRRRCPAACNVPGSNPQMMQARCLWRTTSFTEADPAAEENAIQLDALSSSIR